MVHFVRVYKIYILNVFQSNLQFPINITSLYPLQQKAMQKPGEHVRVLGYASLSRRDVVQNLEDCL